MNIRLLIEYDGASFCGWQRQSNGPSIQAEIERVIERVTGRAIPIQGAGRTDAGVHARGQVASFIVDSNIAAHRWSHVLNDHLPRTIRIVKSDEVAQNFHPQKHAVAKEYEYLILNRPVAGALNPRVYFVPRPINWARVGEALPQFLGEHDFKAFQGARATVLNTVRTISSFTLVQRGDGYYAFRVVGNGFLKQQVRAMAGTLVEIGLGKRDIGDIERILRSKDRKQAGHTAPGCGLTLIRVYYPGE